MNDHLNKSFLSLQLEEVKDFSEVKEGEIISTIKPEDVEKFWYMPDYSEDSKKKRREHQMKVMSNCNKEELRAIEDSTAERIKELEEESDNLLPLINSDKTEVEEFYNSCERMQELKEDSSNCLFVCTQVLKITRDIDNLNEYYSLLKESAEQQRKRELEDLETEPDGVSHPKDCACELCCTTPDLKDEENAMVNEIQAYNQQVPYLIEWSPKRSRFRRLPFKFMNERGELCYIDNPHWESIDPPLMSCLSSYDYSIRNYKEKPFNELD